MHPLIITRASSFFDLLCTICLNHQILDLTVLAYRLFISMCVFLFLLLMILLLFLAYDLDPMAKIITVSPLDLCLRPILLSFFSTVLLNAPLFSFLHLFSLNFFIFSLCSNFWFVLFYLFSFVFFYVLLLFLSYSCIII